MRDRRWDAVLLDWQLSGIDGLGLLQALRALEDREGRPRTPVLVVTATASDAHCRACLEAGVDAFLAKPFTADRLQATLGAPLERAAATASPPATAVPAVRAAAGA